MTGCDVMSSTVSRYEQAVLHQAANQVVLLGLQELIHQGSGDLPELLLQGGHLAATQRG